MRLVVPNPASVCGAKGMITNMVGSEWMCELCGFQASSMQELEGHLKEAHHDFWVTWYTMGDINNGNDKHSRK